MLNPHLFKVRGELFQGRSPGTTARDERNGGIPPSGRAAVELGDLRVGGGADDAEALEDSGATGAEGGIHDGLLCS